jgi:hypothetical protein
VPVRAPIHRAPALSECIGVLARLDLRALPSSSNDYRAPDRMDEQDEEWPHRSSGFSLRPQVPTRFCRSWLRRGAASAGAASIGTRLMALVEVLTQLLASSM